MKAPPVLWLILCLAACSYEGPAAAFSPEGGPRLLALSREAAFGTVSLGALKDLEYRFETPLAVPGDYSLELDYAFGGAAGEGALGEFLAAFRLTLEIDGTAAWELPGDLAFIGETAPPGGMGYRVPLDAPEIRRFSLNWSPRNGDPRDGTGKAAGDRAFSGLVFEFRGIRLVPRWFGFSRAGTRPVVSPFVYASAPGVWVIDPPPRFRPSGGVELSLGGPESPVNLGAGSRRFEYRFPSGELPPGTARDSPAEFRLTAAMLPGEPFPLVFSGEALPDAFECLPPVNRPFPAEPVPADPGLLLAYPEEAWRDPRYELFRWPRFPSILIFDTADYAVQDRLFKRMAFFVEKAGFRGRLVPDAELAELRGWNAHDYRAEDLARFFSAAGEDFPLSPEEGELRSILLREGIIRSAGGADFSPGAGAVLSISRESPDYLRSLFMNHEGFHGLFFIDEDFRGFSRRRWEALDGVSRGFIRSYFDSQRYDLGDDYLMVNEFMAYCLQQPVSQAGRYFGENLAGRIYATPWRRPVLPPGGEDAGVWPELARAFSREAEAFSSYVDRRWGFAAGRVRSVTFRDPPE